MSSGVERHARGSRFAAMTRLVGFARALLLVACGDRSGGEPGPVPNVTVEVVEAWPAGSTVELAPNQNYYVRLAYTTDVPVRIWARPYYRGREVDAGSHGSSLVEDSGETFGWFFLPDPDQRVDEVRINVGRGVDPVASHRVEVVSMRAARAPVTSEPAWVAANRELAKQRELAEVERMASEPMGRFEALLVGGLMGVGPLLGLLALVAPFLAIWRWRGGWRLAAALPLVVMGLVLLNIIVGVVIDPPSHNLWPLELLMVAIVGLVWIGVLALARLFVARRATPGASRSG